jgi:pimeloyl-ACP methyl ester carboxylesterase
MFDPEKIEAKAPQLAESLANTHGTESWKTLCRQTDAFLQALGQGKGIPFDAFAAIQCPVTIGWGDQDHVVTETESRRVAEAIPNGRFVSIPGGKHLIEQVEVPVLVDYVVGCGLM